MGKGDTALNAVIGAVVTFVAAFVPLVGFVSPLAGGGLAAYLQQQGQSEALKVGAISGVIASIPGVLSIVAIVAFVGTSSIPAMGEMPGLGTGAGMFSGLLAIAAVFLILWTVGLSTLGGLIGYYVREN